MLGGKYESYYEDKVKLGHQTINVDYSKPFDISMIKSPKIALNSSLIMNHYDS